MLQCKVIGLSESAQVLIVNSNTQELSSYLTYLETQFNIMCAGHGSQAHDLFATYRFPVVVIDNDYLPDMHAIDLTQSLLRHAIQPQIIMLITCNDTNVQDIRTLPIFDYAVKPVDRDKLSFTIAKAYEHYSLRMQIDDMQEKYNAMEEKFINMLQRTVEVRDPYTAGHQRRVAKIAGGIARVMGLPENDIKGIEMAASIHDIGKIDTPSEYLTRPGKIPAYEMTVIKQHPLVGFELVRDIEFQWPIAAVILQHHERYNGTGYPYNLDHTKIHQFVPIVSIADVGEAMITDRPYRKALSIGETLKTIQGNKGILFGATVVEAFEEFFHTPKFKEIISEDSRTPVSVEM